MIERYVHGYGETEQQRLRDQSQVLASLLHDDTTYEPGARVLEVGCGVGAQTRIVAYRNPQAHFTCIDVSEPLMQQRRDPLPDRGACYVFCRIAWSVFHGSLNRGLECRVRLCATDEIPVDGKRRCAVDGSLVGHGNVSVDLSLVFV